MRHLQVFNALSVVLALFALTMLLPLGVAWYYRDGAEFGYDEAILLAFGSAAVMWLLTRRRRRDLTVRDGFLLVVLTWTVIPIYAALPLWLHIADLSFTDAYFEAVSGLTTTGATVLTGLDTLPVSINLWRMQLHWLGGMGVIVLAVAILPLLGIGGRQLFKAETPGPMKESSLTPRIAETARGLYVVYFLLTIACAVALYYFGMRDMDGWDAVMHAFSIMGLGGFSSRDAGFGHYASLELELVTMVFALLAGINYATHFMAMRSKSVRPYRDDSELPYYLGTLTVSILALTVYLVYVGAYDDFAIALRHVAFHSISMATSLGLATIDYTVWPMFAQLWILFLGSFIACSGSTGGGIKMMRAIILYKQLFRELLRAMHPNLVRPVTLGGAPVSDSVLHAVLGFSFIYMASIVSLTLLLSASGLPIVTAFSAVVTCINNTGPGLDAVGPASNFGVLNDFQTWVCTFTMLLGRLELFTLLVVLTPAFWRR
jgi:trk system potassium uptake protein TrkH